MVRKYNYSQVFFVRDEITRHGLHLTDVKLNARWGQGMGLLSHFLWCDHISNTPSILFVKLISVSKIILPDTTMECRLSGNIWFCDNRQRHRGAPIDTKRVYDDIFKYVSIDAVNERGGLDL